MTRTGKEDAGRSEHVIAFLADRQRIITRCTIVSLSAVVDLPESIVGDARVQPGDFSESRIERRKWFAVAGAFLGVLVCVTSSLSWSAGVFITALEHDPGWTRRDISLAISIHTLAIFVASPLVGALADRLDPGRLASISMLFFGIMLLVTPLLLFRIEGLWITYLLLTFIGLGAGPMVLLKPVVVAFTHNRGLAISLVLTGSGASAFIVPQLVTITIARGGWQWGYIVLGLLAMAVAPILWLTLAGVGRRKGTPADPKTLTAQEGVLFSSAVRDRLFWITSAVTLLCGFGMGGLAIHLVPFLRDSGLDALGAARIASVVGLASIAGRIGTGTALDRIESPAIAMLVFLFGAAGAALLLFFGSGAAWLAVICIGLMIGSEVDVIAYSVSRYFGMLAHSAIFGWQYGMISLGSAAGAFFVGWSRDVQGSYSSGLAVISCLLMISAFSCLLLGRYRYSVH